MVSENVLDVLVPKLVLLVVLVVTPTGTLFPFPLTERLADTVPGVVEPVVTPPPEIQLELAPVSAKFVNVPLFPVPLASLNVLYGKRVLVPEGMP